MRVALPSHWGVAVPYRLAVTHFNALQEAAMVEPTNPNSPRRRAEIEATLATPAEDMRTILLNRISWGAVLAGVVVALVTQLILNLVGIGIGAASINPTAGAGDTPSPTAFTLGAGLWWTASGIVAALAGGYTAGRLAGSSKPSTGGWHGLTAWALSTLLIFWLLTTTIGGIIGGAYRTVTNAISGIGAAPVAMVQQALATDPFGRVEQLVRSAVPGNDPAALRDATLSALRAAFTGDAVAAAQARERAAQLLAQAQNIPIEQARQEVERYAQQYQAALTTMRREIAQAAEVTAQTVSTGALMAAVALVLGAIAAWFGGRFGTIEPTFTNWTSRITDNTRERRQ